MQYNDTYINDNVYVLRQGVELIHQLDHHLYTNRGHLAFTASVGGHVRHCLDFYRCFLVGLEVGKIDYDRRERDMRIEEDHWFAARQLEAIIERLLDLPLDVDMSVLVRMDQRIHSEDMPIWSKSSVLRELQFLLSHTIHHYALIATLLRLQGFEPGDTFGVAPSTLEYRQVTESLSHSQ